MACKARAAVRRKTGSVGTPLLICIEKGNLFEAGDLARHCIALNRVPLTCIDQGSHVVVIMMKEGNRFALLQA